MRWSEEVELLQEEMRRILTYLRWETNKWMDRVLTQAPVPEGTDLSTHLERLTLAEGQTAYANRQATIREQLSARFSRLWHDVVNIALDTTTLPAGS